MSDLVFNLAELEKLERFFKMGDFGQGVYVVHNSVTIEVTPNYVADRIRLMKLAVKANNPKFGIEWYNILLKAQRQMED